MAVPQYVLLDNFSTRDGVLYRDAVAIEPQKIQYMSYETKTLYHAQWLLAKEAYGYDMPVHEPGTELRYRTYCIAGTSVHLPGQHSCFIPGKTPKEVAADILRQLNEQDPRTLLERIRSVEAENDRLRARIKELRPVDGPTL